MRTRALTSHRRPRPAVDAATSTKIGEANAAKGGRFLEAPVSGSKKPAIGELAARLCSPATSRLLAASQQKTGLEATFEREAVRETVREMKHPSRGGARWMMARMQHAISTRLKHTQQHEHRPSVLSDHPFD